MNPAEAGEKLFAFVSGRLGPADRAAFATAMERDPALRRSVANLRLLRDRLSRLRDRVDPDPTLLTAAPEAPAAKKSKGEKAEPVGPRERPIPVSLLVVGLVIVLAGVGLLVFLGGDGEPDPAEQAAAKTARREPEEKKPKAPDEKRPLIPEPVKTDEPRRPVRPTAVKPGVEMLLPGLIQNPSQARLEAIWAALGEKPERASAIYSRIPSAKKEGPRIALILALAPANADPEVRHRLLALLRSDGSPTIRAVAAGALGHVAGADHPKVAVARQFSVRAGIIEDAELRGQLLDAVAAERNPAVVGTLIRLLGPSRARDGTIEDRLVELAHSPEPSLRSAAIDGLRAGSGGSPAVLEKLIDDEKIPVADRARLVAPWALAGRKEPDPEKLYRLIDGVAPTAIRAAAVQALGDVPGQNVVSRVIGIARDTAQDREVRLAALRVLASTPLKDAGRALEGIADTETEDEAIRNAAAELLRARNPKTVEKDEKER